MSDEKPKPVDDLKQGFNLLLRAAKGAVEGLPTPKLEKLEGAVKDGVKEVGRAVETVANEIDKVISKATGVDQPAAAPAAPPPASPPEGEAKPPAPEARYDDAYAPEPPRGPRVG